MVGGGLQSDGHLLCAAQVPDVNDARIWEKELDTAQPVSKYH